MRRNSLLPILLALLSVSLSAQTFFSSKVEGRVYSDDGDVGATHVMNVTGKRATITNVKGFFSISAQLNDTLVFSAVQFKRKKIVVTTTVLKSKVLSVYLEDVLNELDEVIVMPYNLTGDMQRDVDRLDTGPIVAASTLGLPNAEVKVITMAERKLHEATTGGGIVPLNPILNAITGRTKILKRNLARNRKYERTQRVKAFYPDSLFQTKLKIPMEKIDDFMYFCEVDAAFQALVDTHDQLKIWEFFKKKSVIYRENNRLEAMGRQ